MKNSIGGSGEAGAYPGFISPLGTLSLSSASWWAGSSSVAFLPSSPNHLDPGSIQRAGVCRAAQVHPTRQHSPCYLFTVQSSQLLSALNFVQAVLLPDVLLPSSSLG